jgi:hypothetical protein
MISPTSSLQESQWPAGKASTRTASATPVSQERLLRQLETISHLFDDAFRLPGTSVRLGWDAVIGLIPVVGDATTTLVSAYFLWQAKQLGVRKRTLALMLGNVAVDFVVGTIPLVGDVVDVGWRANRRNMRVLVRELERQGKMSPEEANRRLEKLGGIKLRRPQQQSHLHTLQPYPLLMP